MVEKNLTYFKNLATELKETYEESRDLIKQSWNLIVQII